MSLAKSIIPLFHPLLWSTSLPLRRSVSDRIFVSAEYKFIYFRVPKSANSTVALTLAKCMGALSAHDMRGVASKKIGKKFLKSGIIFESQLARYFTFTFVRNPFARALSAYLDKIQPVSSRFRADLLLDETPTSFREFLERLADGFLMANVHWAPQSAVIPVHPSRLNFVGRVETLEEDLAEVLNRIFGGSNHEIVSRTVGVKSSGSRLREFYGGVETELVRKLYARDFELFYPGLADPDSAPRGAV
jgi:hypothetical protein